MGMYIGTFSAERPQEFFEHGGDVHRIGTFSAQRSLEVFEHGGEVHWSVPLVLSDL
jgi:hypothetical protein